jgi:hypothetical protein
MVVTVGRSLQIGSHDGQEYLGITKLMEDDSPSIRWLILFFTNLDAERQIYKRVVTWRVIAEQVFMSERRCCVAFRRVFFWVEPIL